ncbi:MAG: isocitrate lyase/phosphoenolpyruvate mutase family protein [Bacteroidetes bacterium]|nr:isocitrate lyase/phosphoenolpyruvate mutase family protein [Bacteroidota bacterium]
MRTVSSIQQQYAKTFNKLHYSNNLLILPNVWEPLGALLLKSLNYEAIATASASIAFTNAFEDGENISFSNHLAQIKKIVTSVSLPVTADIEKGYASNDEELQKNISDLIDAGVVGINIEDSHNDTKLLVPIEIQCRKIQLIRTIAQKKEIDFFINARTDTFISKDNFTPEEQIKAALLRGHEYKNAGASGFFPLALKNQTHIEKLCKELNYPINILTIPGIPDLTALKNCGVARVSLGPSFLKIAMNAMKQLAIKLKHNDGLNEIVNNEVTTDYLANLIKNK